MAGYFDVKITVLAGGVGGAKSLPGARPVEGLSRPTSAVGSTTRLQRSSRSGPATRPRCVWSVCVPSSSHPPRAPRRHYGMTLMAGGTPNTLWMLQAPNSAVVRFNQRGFSEPARRHGRASANGIDRRDSTGKLIRTGAFLGRAGHRNLRRRASLARVSGSCCSRYRAETTCMAGRSPGSLLFDRTTRLSRSGHARLR